MRGGDSERTCDRCGYVFRPLETDCPRCARARARPAVLDLTTEPLEEPAPPPVPEGPLERDAFGHPRTFPPLPAVVWGRAAIFGLTVLAILALWVLVFRSADQSEFAIFGILALPFVSARIFLTVGLPCLLIAVGVHRRLPIAVWGALATDALLFGFAMTRLTGIFQSFPYGASWSPAGMRIVSLLCSAFGLLFAAEAAYILRLAWRWRPAWPAFLSLGAGLAAVSLILPGVVWGPAVQHVQPLLTYISEHWIAITPETRFELARQMDRAGDHTDELEIREGDFTWEVSARHRSDGRWSFPKGKDGSPTFGIPWRPSGAERRITTPEEAKQFLLDCGVSDRDLQFQRATRYSVYIFWSPLAGGTYQVNGGSRSPSADFYLDQKLEVP